MAALYGPSYRFPPWLLVALSPIYPEDRKVFVAGVDGGIYTSANGGQTWVLQCGTTPIRALDMQISPNYANDQTFFVGSLQQGLLKFGAEGMAVLPLPGGLATALAISPNYANDLTLLAGSPDAVSPDQGVYFSIDAGATWNSTNLTGKTGIDSLSLSPGFAADQTAFAGSPSSGLYKSVDGRKSWISVSSFPTKSPAVAQVLVSPNYPIDHTVFAATVRGGIYRSTNGGRNWSLLQTFGRSR